MTADPIQNSSVSQAPEIGDTATAQLTRIWQDALGIDPIGLDQNYFDLGGDSSTAVHLFAQIERVFSVKLPLATLETIEALASRLR